MFVCFIHIYIYTCNIVVQQQYRDSARPIRGRFDTLRSHIIFLSEYEIRRPTINAPRSFACRTAARAESNENVKSRLLHQTSGPTHASASDERNQEQTHFQHHRGHSPAQHQRVFQISEYLYVPIYLYVYTCSGNY